MSTEQSPASRGAATSEATDDITLHYEMTDTGETLCGLGPAGSDAVPLGDAVAAGEAICIPCDAEHFARVWASDGWPA